MTEEYHHPDETPWPRKGARWSNRTRSFRTLANADKDDLLDKLDEEERRREEQEFNKRMKEVLGSEDRHIGPP